MAAADLTAYGDFTEARVRDAFNEQARALVDGGADAIIIETMTSLEELLVAIEAAKAAGAPCIIGSMAYDVTLDGSTFRTMMGVDPEHAAEFMAEHGATSSPSTAAPAWRWSGPATRSAHRAVTSLPIRCSRTPVCPSCEHEGDLRRDPAMGCGVGAAGRGRRQPSALLPAAPGSSASSGGCSTPISPPSPAPAPESRPNMTFTLCPVNAGAIDKLPAKTD
jgi:hypothetical protein